MQLDDGERERGECGAVAVPGVVGEGLAGEDLSEDVSVDRLIRMHGPRSQLRQAEREAEQGDQEEDRPAGEGTGECQVQAAGLPHTSTSM